MEIEFHRNIKNLSAPVMIAGWPGMGNVALSAVDYICGKLGARLFAEINTEGVSLPDAVVVNKGLAKFPEAPKVNFFYNINPPVIFVEGQAQFSGGEAAALMDKVLDLAREFKVRRIITGAAFPASVSYSQPSQVYVAATRASFLRYFRSQGLKTLSAGQISGLNGLILGFAESRGIEAACLLATLPQYAISLPCPRAAWAVIQVICKVLGVKIDLSDMNRDIKEMDRKMSGIEEKMKDLFPVSEIEEPIDLGSDRVPAYVMKKIEKLFREVGQEKEKATELKQELDRWDLYGFYEDRFLDLFKKQQ